MEQEIIAANTVALPNFIGAKPVVLGSLFWKLRRILASEVSSGLTDPS